jgi:hypothetical protein
MITDRPTFIVHFRPEPGVDDPIRALRLLLKTASRRYGLRCVNAVAHAVQPVLEDELDDEVAI